MLGDSSSSVLGSSGDAVAAMAAAVPAHDGAEVGGVGSNSGEEDKGYRGDELGDRSYGGNRWPRQETLALLKIRSDMDVAFRDASVKGPLWEEVSRKLAELGYHRSAKKCKEKFENVYKYHKRTKEGRTGKPDGKTYRFFDQLEALDSHPSIQSPTTPKPHQTAPVAVATSTTTVAMPPLVNPPSLPQITVTSAIHSTMNISQGINVAPAILNLTIPSFPPSNPTVLPPPPITTNPPHNRTFNLPFKSFPRILFLIPLRRLHRTKNWKCGARRKRKWKDFFERLMKEVIQKQEELQKKFLEAIEKREHERMVREEAWRVQEMARINREREILAQERSIAAAKDAAVMAFLQKLSEQQNPGQAAQYDLPQPQPVQPAPHLASQQALPVAQPAPILSVPAALPQSVTGLEIQKIDNGENFTPASSSRWPKVEVQALIKLRTNLDAKYQDSGPKGPLWEEISAAMRKLGYNRSSKRCKEKWENINKYFKKPEQQWPPQQDHPSDAPMEDAESDPMDQNQEEDDKDGDEEEEDDEGSGNYEIVASKPASMGAAE
ncbi:Trihelix transcription factor GT-2 [Morella rubra]|uniref:Trihelix transcription factor GT-2 n=1 Tax=Morella rubra TaxID=262757 RepID=A0A6A1W6L6_9ROSI|nr:Trihelix transcription factor GT-2 [Morella rubra]